MRVRMSLIAAVAVIVMMAIPSVPASSQNTLSVPSSLTVSTGAFGFGYSQVIVNSTLDGNWTFAVNSIQGNITYAEVAAFCADCPGSTIWPVYNPVVDSSFTTKPLPHGEYYVLAFALGSPNSQLTISILPPTTVSAVAVDGLLVANFDVGPITPVCSANATSGPAPSYFSSIWMVVTDSSGMNVSTSLGWVSNGCDAVATGQAFLPPGNYALNLSSCLWMGCKASPPPVPRSFTISPGQETDLTVTINTGIA